MADKIKKLSEAIRLGATFRPQCAHVLFINNKSCAIGAAAEAIGREYGSDNTLAVAAVYERFQITTPIWSEILRRNDELHQSREDIADWLESIGH